MDAGFKVLTKTTPMPAQEARECVDAIKGNLESLRAMLLDLHRRRGWEAIGYANFREFAIAEFGQGQAYIYRLVQAAEVEENLGQVSIIVENGEIPTSQLVTLAKLPKEQQAEGLLKANEIAQAQGKKRNATHMAQAVKEIKPSKKQTKTQSKFVDATLINIEQELEQKVEELGLSISSCQALPEVEHNHSSSLNVSFRPFVAARSSVGVNTADIYRTLTNNVQYLSDSNQLDLVWGAIAPHISAKTLGVHRWSDADLKRLIKDAKRLIKDAKRELNQRHDSEYQLLKLSLEGDSLKKQPNFFK